MIISRVDAIANAVLYEGYMLYPYRPSAVKNQQRFNFGVVAPEARAKASFSNELSCITTECLLRGGRESQLELEVRFLQLVQRDIEVRQASSSQAASGLRSDFAKVENFEMSGRILSSWQEAIERRVGLGPFSVAVLLDAPVRKKFSFDAVRETEPVFDDDGDLSARFVRHRQSISGYVDLLVTQLDAHLFKMSVSVANDSPLAESTVSSREGAMLTSFLSTHKVLRCSSAEFISLTDPPEELRDSAAVCKNTGTWPVLASESEEHPNVLLSSPIILYDYPEIAQESPGDLFDGTEIDEILALRILTMTDEEKREMRSVDDRTRRILERTELLRAEHFMKLHGAMRGLAPAEKARR